MSKLMPLRTCLNLTTTRENSCLSPPKELCISIPFPKSITIGNALIPFKQSEKNFGFTLDCYLSMNAHVSTIARTYYFELHRLASTGKNVLSQVSSYLNSHNLYNTFQSAYPPGHSTETALLKVVDDLFLSPNKGTISVLALLDFSSTFDTIDHTTLVHRLHTDFGFTDTVLQWFSSYLTGRTHYVSLSNHCSALAPVHSAVPQGSVLGPILFTMYIKPLSAIIDSHYHTSFIF